MSVYHHLVALGLWKDVLSTSVGLGGAAAGGWLPWRRHRRTQQAIADRLDTSTPGGLGDLVPKTRKASQ